MDHSTYTKKSNISDDQIKPNIATDYIDLDLIQNPLTHFKKESQDDEIDTSQIDKTHYVSYLIQFTIPDINFGKYNNPLPVHKYLINSDSSCLSFPIDLSNQPDEEVFKYKKEIRKQCKLLQISKSKINKITHFKTDESSTIINHIYICELSSIENLNYPNLINTSPISNSICWKDYFDLKLKYPNTRPCYIHTITDYKMDISKF